MTTVMTVSAQFIVLAGVGLKVMMITSGYRLRDYANNCTGDAIKFLQPTKGRLLFKT